MTGDTAAPIFAALARAAHTAGHDITSLLTHAHYHHHQNPHTTGDTPVNALIDTIKQDLAGAGHTIDQAVHDILTHRLSITSVLAYAAEEITRIQSSPLAPLAERYIGLPPAAAAAVAHVADVVAQDTAALLTGTPPAPDPAQPAA